MELRMVGLFVVLIAVSEASSIARRSTPKVEPSEDGALEKEEPAELKPDLWDPAGFDWEGNGLGPDQPSDPETDGKDGKEDDERFPPLPESDEDPEYDGGSEEAVGSDEPPVHEEGGESTDEEDEELDPDQPGTEEPEDRGTVPDFGGDTGFWDKPGFLGTSMFDTPFFNLEQVRKYFNQLERALGHVFRETLDEARLLNGTYANTTEEEVTIGGKTYTVQKSVINSADNRSAIYVETLSSTPKEKPPKETH